MSVSVFAVMSDDLVSNILRDLSWTDIKAFFASDKALRLLDIPSLQHEWLKGRTESQLRAVFEEAVESNNHSLAARLLQPRFVETLGTPLLAASLIKAVRIRRNVALRILPFCRCSIMKSSLAVLKQALEFEGMLNLRLCQLQVYGCLAATTFVNFTANMKPTSNGAPGSLDCIEWPLPSRVNEEGITFWLNAPTDSPTDEWAPVTADVTLQHQWLRVHCQI